MPSTPSNPAPKPTASELAILRVLWERGPSTVRQVHETLGRDTTYTTVLKFLQIMADKGLVARDDSARSHVFRAAQHEGTTQRRLVKDLLERAFGGSTQALVQQALSAKRASPEDIAEIRRLLDDYEKGQP
jgi:BlaI family transcriptional regulator, penicillinase repressor